MEETFENQFERLQEVVALLENGQTPLEESLQLYEEGIRLIRACHEKLTGARRRIELIAGLDSLSRSQCPKMNVHWKKNPKQRDDDFRIGN